MDRRILVVAALLAGCPEPPPESGCQLPLVPTIDGTAVSFRVEGCARGDLTARMLGTGNLDLRWAWVDGALVPSVSGGVAGGVLEGLVLEGPVTLQGDDVRLWKQEVPGEVVDVVQRKAAQPRRQRAALAVVWDAQGALEVERQPGLRVHLGEGDDEAVVLEPPPNSRTSASTSPVAAPNPEGKGGEPAVVGVEGAVAVAPEHHGAAAALAGVSSLEQQQIGGAVAVQVGEDEAADLDAFGHLRDEVDAAGGADGVEARRRLVAGGQRLAEPGRAGGCADRAPAAYGSRAGGAGDADAGGLQERKGAGRPRGVRAGLSARSGRRPGR